MRIVVSALLMAFVMLAAAVPAFGHAVPVTSTPEEGEIVDRAPERLTITFNEPVQLLRADDFTVVDASGTSVGAGPGAVTDDRRVIAIDLEPDLAPGTYTVRYKVIGADSHVIPYTHVFGVGVSAVGPPYLGDGSSGPSATGPWGISSRVILILALSGLLGLIAARWMIWAPVWRRPPPDSEGEREAALIWWRDGYWTAFSALAVIAMLAQTYALVVQGARALGVGVGTALRDPAGLIEVLDRTDFGAQIQFRGAVLFCLFILAGWLAVNEYSDRGGARPAAPTRSPLGSALMALLVLTTLGSIAAQGHARVAELPWLQIAAHLGHTAAAAVWITGFVVVIAATLRLPAIAPTSGPALAGGVLSAFSRVAAWAIVTVIVTGVIRSIGELGGLSELWETAYGRSIVYKVILLAPLTAIALYNRRILAALRRRNRPGTATLRLVRRNVACELALALAIVFVAEILVAQIPGGG